MTQDDQDQEYVDDVYADDAAYDAELIDADMDGLPTDEWAEGDVQEEPQARPAKKKSNMFSPFNIAVVGVAVLAGGFFIWKTLAPQAPVLSPAEQQAAEITPVTPEMPAIQQQAEATASVTQPEIEAEYPAPVPAAEMSAAVPTMEPVPDNTGATTGGFVGDASKLVKAGEEQVPAPAPMPPPAEEQVPPVAEVVPSAPATQEAPPALMTAPETEQAKVEPVAPVPEPAPAPEVAVTPPAPEPVVEAAPEVAMPKEPEAAPEMPKSNPEIAELRAEIDRLKAELELAKAAPKESAQEVAASQPQENVVDLSPTVVEPKPKAAPKKIDTRKAVTKKATSSWELRSAKAGSAMIARKGESDLQIVSVGDNIAGLGRITNISNDSGRWIVQGTSGRLMQ